METELELTRQAIYNAVTSKLENISKTTFIVLGTSVAIPLIVHRTLNWIYQYYYRKRCSVCRLPPMVSGDDIFKTKDMEVINLRKPVEIWNAALFFPDKNQEAEGSPTKRLFHYFEEAQFKIQVCMYLVSYKPIVDLIIKKYREGLIVQVISDYDTYTAHNNWGVKAWKRTRIPVKLRATGTLMHNKFSIIDDEAVLTGSLNWTRQGFIANREDVLITTHPVVVKKYVLEFGRIWSLFDQEYEPHKFSFLSLH